MPRPLRRFMLDRLHGARVAETLSAGSVRPVPLPNGLMLFANPLLHGSLFVGGHLEYEPDVVELLRSRATATTVSMTSVPTSACSRC